MFQKTVWDSVLPFTSVFSDPFWTFNEPRVALRLPLEPTEASDFTFGPNRGKWGRPPNRTQKTTQSVRRACP